MSHQEIVELYLKPNKNQTTEKLYSFRKHF